LSVIYPRKFWTASALAGMRCFNSRRCGKENEEPAKAPAVQTLEPFAARSIEDMRINLTIRA
jgi:hypothetical protein